MAVAEAVHRLRYTMAVRACGNAARLRVLTVRLAGDGR